jgi:3-hydroxyisobutyrate dehydrogenase-like beta-hydroxyacid dehydrogenase
MSGQDQLGFVGVGVMGGRMCRNLAQKSGQPVLAFDTNPVPLQRLTEHKVEVAPSLGDLAKRADIIMLSLPGEPQVRAAVLGPGGLLSHARKGQIIVDTSTVPVRLSQEAAAVAAAKGVHYLDAPVSRGVNGAETGTLNFMVGGEADAFARIRPYLACMGTDITHCGKAGAGTAVKLMNNMVVAQTVRAIAEALKVAQLSGAVDGKVLFETMTTGSADSFVLRNHGLKSMLPGTHPLQTFPVTYILKDLAYALELAESCGVTMTGAETTVDLLKTTQAMGLAERYYTIMIDGIDVKKV